MGVEERRGVYKCLVSKFVTSRHLEVLGVDRRIVNHKWDVGHGLDWSGSR
jgi:hypothetical protein